MLPLCEYAQSIPFSPPLPTNAYCLHLQAPIPVCPRSPLRHTAARFVLWESHKQSAERQPRRRPTHCASLRAGSWSASVSRQKKKATVDAALRALSSNRSVAATVQCCAPDRQRLEWFLARTSPNIPSPSENENR